MIKCELSIKSRLIDFFFCDLREHELNFLLNLAMRLPPSSTLQTRHLSFTFTQDEIANNIKRIEHIATKSNFLSL